MTKIITQATGLLTPRERMWAVIRQNPNDFTPYQVEREARINLESAKAYLKCLLKGGFVELSHIEKHTPGCFSEKGHYFQRHHYRLLRDVGVEAPRVNRRGELVTHGDNQQAMWVVLRMGGTIDADALAAIASSAGENVSTTTARHYLHTLKEAGYLLQARQAVPGQYKAQFKLKAAMNTGPKAPRVQSTVRVWDPNLAEAVYQERPELAEELRDGIPAQEVASE